MVGAERAVSNLKFFPCRGNASHYGTEKTAECKLRGKAPPRAALRPGARRHAF